VVVVEVVVVVVVVVGVGVVVEVVLEIIQVSNRGMEKIEIYSNGIVHCSVCAPKGMKRSILTREVNLQNPTGVSPWRISKESFADGKKNPNQCEDHEDRQHYLFVC